MAQPEQAPEPFVLSSERGEHLRRVSRRVTFGQQGLEPGAAAAAELGFSLQPHDGGQNRLPEAVRDAPGDPLGREERRHREHQAADEQRGVPPTEASVRRGEHS